MRFKKGVRLHGVRPELVAAFYVTDSVYLKFGQELVITSVIDSKHGQYSLHYVGAAFDCRTYYFKDIEEIKKVASELREALGDDFDVVVEKDHIHIEFQPQTGYTA